MKPMMYLVFPLFPPEYIARRPWQIYPNVVAIVSSCGDIEKARQWFPDRGLIEDLAAFDRDLVARRFPNSGACPMPETVPWRGYRALAGGGRRRKLLGSGLQ